MIVLDSTLRKLVCVVGGSPGTQFQITVAYTDVTSSASTPGSYTTQTNSLTQVDVLAAPAASTQRIVHSININNTAGTYLFTLSYSDNGTLRSIWSGYLDQYDTLHYDERGGLSIIDNYGRLGQSSTRDNFVPLVTFPVEHDAVGLTSTFATGTGACLWQYIGRALSSHNGAAVRYRVTTAATVITWAEAAIYRGSPDLGGTAYLDLLGYADISGAVGSTGQKTSSITLSGTQEGDHLWMCWGIVNSGTGLVLRACQYDNNQVNAYLVQYLATGMRPSTAGQVNTTAYTLGTLQPWFAVQFSG